VISRGARALVCALAVSGAHVPSVGAQGVTPAGVTIELTTEMRAGSGAPRRPSRVTVRAAGNSARVDGTDGGLPPVLQRMAGPSGYLLITVERSGEAVFVVVNPQKREALQVRAAQMASMGDAPAGARLSLDSLVVRSRLLQPPGRVMEQSVRRATVDERRVYSLRTPQGTMTMRMSMSDTVSLGATASLPRGTAAAMALLAQSTPLAMAGPTAGTTVVQGQRPVGVPLQLASWTTLASDAGTQRLHRTVTVTSITRGTVDPSVFLVPPGVRVSDASVLFGTPPR
jgi:hypothetical protein